MAAVVDNNAATMPTVFTKVPESLVLHILDYTIFSIQDYLAINTVNKSLYNLTRKSFWFATFPEEDFVFAKRTMIQTNRCMSCYEKKERTHTKVVAFHEYPKGCYIFCDKFECARKCLRSYVQMADNVNINLLAKPITKESGLVRRSSGQFQKCRYASMWLWQNQSIRCYFYIGKQDYYKDVPVRLIPKEFITNPIQVITL